MRYYYLKKIIVIYCKPKNEAIKNIFLKIK